MDVLPAAQERRNRGDDTLIGNDDGTPDKLNGEDGFDDCLFGGGDELDNCEM